VEFAGVARAGVGMPAHLSTKIAGQGPKGAGG